MTSEQIAELRKLKTLPPGPERRRAVYEAAVDFMPRLLDEREVLLGALRGLDTDCEPTGAIGSHRDTEGNGGWAPEECPLCRARAAIAKAESP